MRQVNKPQFYKNLSRKTSFFKKWSWFKLNNLGLVLAIISKFYASVATKGLILKIRTFWLLIPTFVEVEGGKMSEQPFCPPSPILKPEQGSGKFGILLI